MAGANRSNFFGGPGLRWGVWLALAAVAGAPGGWKAAAAETAAVPFDADAYVHALAAVETSSSDRFATAFEEAVRQRVMRDGLDEAHARIEVRRDLASRQETNGRWAEASLHYGQALLLAEALQDADAMLDLNLARSHAMLRAGDRWLAIDHAHAAWDLARKLGRPARQIEAGLELAGQLIEAGRPGEAEPYYTAMLALPGADQLAIELDRARRTKGQNDGVSKERWQRVASLAQERNDAPTEARALNELAELSDRRGDLAGALGPFRRADQLAPGHARSAVQWEIYSRALAGAGDKSGARRAIEQALARADPREAPLATADLRDAHAAMLADAGEYAAAYAALREAQALRARPKMTEWRSAASLISGVTPNQDMDRAAALAAVRNALRESELATARLRQRMAIGGGVAALLLAAALGVAYTFKRRAAAALAGARDAAELRAERTHGQMLRYQLNPHFLFNALTSIRSQLPPGLVRARDAIDRLADFCRMTLQAPRTDERIRLGDELRMLRAYLDIERSRLGPLLGASFEIDEGVMDEFLPRLLLLPLVENAVKYGAATSVDRLEVNVAARRAGEGVEIEIANTGRWVEPSAGGAVASLGVGHANLRDRLQRHYPNTHEFTHEERDGWVRVKLRLGRPLGAGEVWARATASVRKAGVR